MGTIKAMNKRKKRIYKHRLKWAKFLEYFLCVSFRPLRSTSNPVYSIGGISHYLKDLEVI